MLARLGGAPARAHAPQDPWPRVEGDDFRVLRSWRRSRLENCEPAWDFRLAPGATAKLSYTVRYTE